jgi:hypothetical protein
MKAFEERLNEINKKMKEAIQEKNELFKDMKEQGYYVDENDQIQKNKATMGLFWDFSYCDYYVGEKGMYTTDGKGAAELTEKQCQTIKQLFKDGDYEAVVGIIEKVMDIDGYFLEGPLENGKVFEENGIWTWKTKDKGEMDGQMNPGSKIYIKETSKQEIESFESYYDEDVAP